MNNKTIIEFGFRIIWRIMETEEGVIHRGRKPRRITPSEISIILHMIRKPNSIIVLLFSQNNSSFKNMAKHAYLHRSIDVKFIFDSACLGLFSSASILQIADGPWSCLLAVLATFLVIFSPSSYSWNEWNGRHFSSSQPKQLNLVSRSSRLAVH